MIQIQQSKPSALLAIVPLTLVLLAASPLAASAKTVAKTPAPAVICDPIGGGKTSGDLPCLLPFPNDFYSKPDPRTSSGRRLAITAGQMPRNTARNVIDPLGYNRNDGFSGNSPILARVPGLESKAALAQSKIAIQTDMARSLESNQGAMLIDYKTGKQELIWSEVDESTASASKRLLMIHGGTVLREGRRFIVVLRNLKTASGAPIQPSAAFRQIRDRKLPANASAALKARAKSLEPVFARLKALGVARNTINLAWDFTTASSKNLSERILTMRDESFAALGDTTMTDLKPQGRSPEVTITNVKNYTTSESEFVLRRVRGTVKVPCYLGDITVGGAKILPCGPGTSMNFGSNGLPKQFRGSDGQLKYFNAGFTCMVPRSAPNSTQMATDVRALIYGHGLLGDSSEVEGNVDEPAMTSTVMCAGDWIGLSGIDIATVLTLLPNMDRFRTLPDRSQQGLLNFMHIGRWMISQAAGGMNNAPLYDPPGADPAYDPFDPGAGTELVSDEQPLYYVGGSQGGIMGGALTAVASDFEKSVLIVPAVGYATLLYRSIDFNKFLQPFRSGYGSPQSQQVVLSLIQTLWDRGEGGGYAHHMTHNTLPNTPPHKVVLVMGFGDHQVSNIQTETQARTINAVVRTPSLDPGRSTDVEPFVGIPGEPLSSFQKPGGYKGWATLIPVDIGPVRGTVQNPAGTNPNPTRNQPPIGPDANGLFDGLDPHTVASRSDASLGIVFDFLQPGAGVTDTCNGNPCYAGGWGSW